MKYLFLALLLCLVCQPLSAQEAFSTIEERMTGKEFSETGLSKLTPEELAALNRWLRSHSVATLENATQAVQSRQGLDARGLENMDDEAVVSRIVGTFDGWEGKGTLFKLENGMIWMQAESGTFHMPATENPVVNIEPGFFNSWRLQIEGYNKTVRVERVQ
jgi:hypothetical protein